MVSLALALSTCFFCVNSLATSCVDDEVALFQSQIQVKSRLPRTLLLELENTVTMSKTVLEDIDEELSKMKDYLYDLQLKPRMQQAMMLQQVAGWLPTIVAMDKNVLEFRENISSASWDWVDSLYNTHGTNVDGLHEAAKIFDVLDKLPLEAVGNGKLDQMADMANSFVTKSDKAMNGFDTAIDEGRWEKGNASLSKMQESLHKLMDAKQVFDEEVKLYSETIETVAGTAFVAPSVRDAVVQVPEAVGKLHADYIKAFESYEKSFEQHFKEMDVSKEKYAKADAEAAAQAVKQGIQDTAQAVQQGIQDATEAITEAKETVQETLAPVTDVLKAMADRKAQMQAAKNNATAAGEEAKAEEEESAVGQPAAKPVAAKPAETKPPPAAKPAAAKPAAAKPEEEKPPVAKTPVLQPPERPAFLKPMHQHGPSHVQANRHVR